MIRVYSEIVYNEKGKEIISENKLFIKPSDMVKLLDSTSFYFELMQPSKDPNTIGFVPEFISISTAIKFLENKLNNTRCISHLREWRRERAKALIEYLEYMSNRPRKLKCINETSV